MFLPLQYQSRISGADVQLCLLNLLIIDVLKPQLISGLLTNCKEPTDLVIRTIIFASGKSCLTPNYSTQLQVSVPATMAESE